MSRPVKVFSFQSRSSSLGFTLLEAIVSLAIFSMVSIALLSVVNVGMRNYQDAEYVADEQRVIRNAVDRLLSAGALQTQTGEYADGAYKVRWQAKALEPPRPALFITGRASRYQLVLYSVDLILLDSANNEIRRENVRITNYRRSTAAGAI